MQPGREPGLGVGENSTCAVSHGLQGAVWWAAHIIDSLNSGIPTGFYRVKCMIREFRRKNPSTDIDPVFDEFSHFFLISFYPENIVFDW